jgi:hypothetical protein
MGTFNFVTGYEKDLSKKPLLSFNLATSEGDTGHPGFICHKQPELERESGIP